MDADEEALPDLPNSKVRAVILAVCVVGVGVGIFLAVRETDSQTSLGGALTSASAAAGGLALVLATYWLTSDSAAQLRIGRQTLTVARQEREHAAAESESRTREVLRADERAGAIYLESVHSRIDAQAPRVAIQANLLRGTGWFARDRQGDNDVPPAWLTAWREANAVPDVRLTIGIEFTLRNFGHTPAMVFLSAPPLGGQYAIDAPGGYVTVNPEDKVSLPWQYEITGGQASSFASMGRWGTTNPSEHGLLFEWTATDVFQSVDDQLRFQAEFWPFERDGSRWHLMPVAQFNTVGQAVVSRTYRAPTPTDATADGDT